MMTNNLKNTKIFYLLTCKILAEMYCDIFNDILKSFYAVVSCFINISWFEWFAKMITKSLIVMMLIISHYC